MGWSTTKRPSSAIEMAFHWRADIGPPLNAGLVNAGLVNAGLVAL